MSGRNENNEEKKGMTVMPNNAKRLLKQIKTTAHKKWRKARNNKVEEAMLITIALILAGWGIIIILQ